MDAEPITSRRNQHVVDARKLRLRKHRERQGRLLVEGLQLLHMAVDAGWRPREVFFEHEAAARHASPETIESLLAGLTARGATILNVSANVMAALADRDDPQGVIATFDQRTAELAALEFGSASSGPALVVVLDRLQDPGNLGTLIRTADAVGASAVALLGPAVDPFDPKSVRGTMGSLFHVPLVVTQDALGLFDRLAAAGFRVVGADAHGGVDWGAGLLEGRLALVLGNEARGLSPDVAAHLQGRARLPVSGAAESLNVAVAGGILMYLWLRAANLES